MKKLVWIIVSLILITFAVRTFWNMQLTAVSSDETVKSLIITKGQSVSDVADKLKEQGLIKSPFFFKLYLNQSGLADQMQTGTFKLSPSMSSAEITKKLTTQAEDVWITLIEGWRLEEMVVKLSAQLGVKSNEFIKKAKEGYMFPDTYLFPREVTVEGIVKKLRDTFDQKYSDELKSKIRTQGLTENQGVILASIVEREARSDEVRKMVASILLKRLKIDMGLNADATIQYALGYQEDEKSWWKRHLSKEDLKIDSPFNTYIHRGLPPTPIANPSLSSLQAVADADPNTPYLYYYHDSKGNSYYAKTLDDHNKNVANNP